MVFSMGVHLGICDVQNHYVALAMFWLLPSSPFGDDLCFVGKFPLLASPSCYMEKNTLNCRFDTFTINSYVIRMWIIYQAALIPNQHIFHLYWAELHQVSTFYSCHAHPCAVIYPYGILYENPISSIITCVPIFIICWKFLELLTSTWILMHASLLVILINLLWLSNNKMPRISILEQVIVYNQVEKNKK